MSATSLFFMSSLSQRLPKSRSANDGCADQEGCFLHDEWLVDWAITMRPIAWTMSDHNAINSLSDHNALMFEKRRHVLNVAYPVFLCVRATCPAHTFCVMITARIHASIRALQSCVHCEPCMALQHQSAVNFIIPHINKSLDLKCKREPAQHTTTTERIDRIRVCSAI